MGSQGRADKQCLVGGMLLMYSCNISAHLLPFPHVGNAEMKCWSVSGGPPAAAVDISVPCRLETGSRGYPQDGFITSLFALVGVVWEQVKRFTWVWHSWECYGSGTDTPFVFLKAMSRLPLCPSWNCWWKIRPSHVLLLCILQTQIWEGEDTMKSPMDSVFEVVVSGVLESREKCCLWTALQTSVVGLE